ncbi:MAG: methylenetetrahydrofolate reductase [Clostridia bacterium]|nr:methylenetetrahydrofolate reductase [NAD(P)H] [Clostridia bacterium]
MNTNNSKCPISFEIFPPKGELDITGFRNMMDGFSKLDPEFISVTYSAGGGGNSHKTIDLASIIQNEYNIPSIAHLTCINSNKQEVDSVIDSIAENGIKSVLALRGDIVEGKTPTDFKFAKELIPLLKERGLNVGAACYPEGHVTCENLSDDIRYLKEKEDAGADFFLSQLFFDNYSYYKFLERAEKQNISKPIHAGIMPISSKSQIMRMIFMCGASLPRDIILILNKYENNPEDLRKAGIEYASKQIIDLMKNGVDGIHIYSMNKPENAAEIIENIKKA